LNNIKRNKNETKISKMQKKDGREDHKKSREKDVDGSGWVTESSAVFEDTLFGDSPAKIDYTRSNNNDKKNPKNNVHSTMIRDNSHTQIQTESSQVLEKYSSRTYKRKLVGGRDAEVGATDGSRVRIEAGTGAGFDADDIRSSLERGAQSLGDRDGAHPDKAIGRGLSQTSLLSISPISATQGRPIAPPPSQQLPSSLSRPNAALSNKEKEASKRVSEIYLFDRECLFYPPSQISLSLYLMYM
jgi:hypothetical protein